jgi:PAS domain S-box-containing protein
MSQKNVLALPSVTETTFPQLLESAPDAIVISDKSGRIVVINRMTEKLFGYGRDDLIGQPIETLIPERYRSAHPNHRQGYYSDLPTRPMGKGLELFGRRKDGSEFPVEIGLSPLVAGESLLVTAVIRDVSERKKIQQELERHSIELEASNKELEQFAYVASHDLQEPLRMVASYAQLLARRNKGKLDEDSEEFIDYIVDGATRMQALINDLLSYSRVGSRGKDLVPTDSGAVLQRVLANLRTTIENEHASVTHDTMPKILADASQLAQIFQNLISNAIKFHGEKAPVVHIGAKQSDDEVIFSVKDEGIGIEKKYTGRIFEIFQRLHGKHEYPGTGIGLAICKKIVERHGGRIWIESEENKGSTFFFTIRTPGNTANEVQQ